MNEAAPQPEHSEEKPREKTHQDNIEHIHDVMDEAIDRFNDQQEYEKKREEIKHSLEQTKNRTQEAYLKDSPETAFVAEKKPKQASMLKKMVVWGSMVLGLSSIAKEATATSGGNKEGAKKEVVRSAETYMQLTDEHKESWNDYVDWLETKGLKGSHKLDHKDFSDQMMNEFNEEFAGKGRFVSRDMVKSIQFDLKNYQMQLNELEHRTVAKGNNSLLDHAAPGQKDFHFMADLDNTGIDGYAGAYTTRFKFPVTVENVTHKKYFKSIAPHTQDQKIVFDSQKDKPEITGFATPTASQFEKNK